MQPRTLRTLIVDDSENDEMLLLELLRNGGFEVIARRIETPSELDEEMTLQPWDIVLCDHQMPKLDSPVALDIVRRHNQDTPFFLISGAMEEKQAAMEMMRGATDFISKNDLSRLVPAVERELQKNAMRSALEQANRTLGTLKLLDHSTGLANRNYLINHLGNLLERDQQASGAVILMELGRFKQFVQAVGAEIGRKLLYEAAMRMYEFDLSGLIGRLDDDKLAFVTSLPVNENRLEQTLRQLAEAFESPLLVEGQEYYMHCRVGGSRFPEDGRIPAELLNRAETALSRTREGIERRYFLYHPGLEYPRRHKLELEQALYQAVRNGEFQLHYQPQFDLASRQLVGVEALLRWNRPGYGFVSPLEFIPILEETHLIIPVGEWVCRTAISQNSQWQKQGLPPIKMAVNLSAIQFRQPDLEHKISSILAETGLDPSLLELEITENIAMLTEQELTNTLMRLKQTGIRLALDDFGTGYSSLSYLRRFPIETLKIDRSFVQDMFADSSGAALVKAIRGIASCLNLKVVAEGVETERQAMFLQSIGCEEVQGYHFGQPVEAIEIERLLTELQSSGALLRTSQ